MRVERLAVGALLAVSLLTGCSGNDGSTAPETPPLAAADAGHNTADHFSSRVPLDETLVSPCNGETIHLTGTAFEQATFVDTRENLDNGGSLHTEHQGVISESGIGLTSGASYGFHDSFHELFESPSVSAPNFIATFSETGRVTSPTSGLSFTSRFSIHVVGLPSGELKVTKVTDTGENPDCR
jgi:hypothetical protein